MNICVVLHSLVPGGGIQERRVALANEWVKMGIKVDFVVPVRTELVVDNLNNDVNVSYLGKWKNKNRYHFLYMLIPLIKYFKINKDYDAVLASGSIQIFLTAIALIIAKNNTPLFGTLHTSFYNCGDFKQKVTSNILKLILYFSSYRVSGYAAVSNGLLGEIKKITKNKKKVSLLYNPVIDCFNTNLFKEPDLSFINNKFKKVILGVGRLTQQKGFDLLIEAFSKISNECCLLIIGDGEEKSKLQKTSEKYGITEKVIFLGYKQNIYSYMKYADCFVLPSRWEGFGNVLVEALYAELPIVSFDCPHGPREILENGKWGALVRNGDITEMAKEIEVVINKGMRFKNDRWKDFCVNNVAKKYLIFMGLNADS